MKEKLSMNANTLVRTLKKQNLEFTKADLIKFVEDYEIEAIKFMYVAGDGRLKSLNFIITNTEHLDTILTYGERVDGSSLFSFIEAGSSDLYVIPRFSTAFIDPFAEIPTLSLLCSFFNKDGLPLESAPENVVLKAANAFKQTTGLDYEAMGELEYYVISEDDNEYIARDQKGYHESGPFSKFEEFRVRCMQLIAQSGGYIKYGHSEVGNFRYDGKIYEQNEIEFLPRELLQAADQLVIAKWIIRNLANQYGLTVTFAPKITVGKAGSGLHIHMRMMKAGKNQMLKAGKLSTIAKTAIAGMMECAGALTAFGNLNPTSYFRLVPHQEAPTNICWGDRNRSVLVRVPLGWTGKTDMCSLVNPLEKPSNGDVTLKQTVEFRCPDGSANVYFLLAGLAVACRHGFEMQGALDYTEKTYVNVNIFKDEHKEKIKDLAQLPSSCCESADILDEKRFIFEKYGVFSPGMIDEIIKDLKGFNDKKLRTELEKDSHKMMDLVNAHFHCG